MDQVVALYHPEAAYPAAGFWQPRDGTVLPSDLAPLTFDWDQPVAAAAKLGDPGRIRGRRQAEVFHQRARGVDPGTW